MGVAGIALHGNDATYVVDQDSVAIRRDDSRHLVLFHCVQYLRNRTRTDRSRVVGSLASLKATGFCNEAVHVVIAGRRVIVPFVTLSSTRPTIRPTILLSHRRSA